MNRNIVLLILSVFCLALNAQSPVKEKINDIKRDSNYLWAEATEDTKEKAYEAAKVSLTIVAKEYFSSLDLPAVNAKVDKCEQMYMERGSKYRVFVYIPKDVAAVEVPVPEQSAPTKYIINRPAPTDSNISDSSLKPWQQNLIGNILKCSDVDEVVNYLERMQVQNKVTQIGTKSKQPHNPENAFYVYFDNNLHLKAVLGKVEQRKRKNYVTNNMDSQKDYSHDAYLWFILPN